MKLHMYIYMIYLLEAHSLNPSEVIVWCKRHPEARPPATESATLARNVKAPIRSSTTANSGTTKPDIGTLDTHK